MSVRSFGSRAKRAAAGALVVALSTTILLASTSVAHAIVVRVVDVKTSDTGNGKIDQLHVRFTAPMAQEAPEISTGPGDAGFRVQGYSIAGFTWTGDTSLVIHLNEGPTYDGDATPRTIYEAGGGGANSALGTEADAFDLLAIDAAGPVLIGAYANDQGSANLFNMRQSATSNGDELRLLFSEPATLTGSSPSQRWSNLEKAIRFNNEGGGCPVDGQGNVDFFNFPQPDLGVVPTGDGLRSPTNDSEFTSVFKIRFVTGTRASNPVFVGVPALCWLGIESSSINTGFIMDAAGNAAIKQVTAAPIIKNYVRPLDATMLYAQTLDTNADSFIDAMRLVFDQRIDDAVLADHLDKLRVSLLGVDATVDTTQVHTGATANDNVIELPFTFPEGTVWDSGALPTVSYAKPAECVDGTGFGIKMIPPAGNPYRACLGSFSLTSWDAARPLIASAVTTDGDRDGKLDRVTVTFTEALSQGTAAGWTLNGQPATGFTFINGKRGAEIPIQEGAIGDTGASATLAYAPQATKSLRSMDAWENEIPATNLTATDGAAPRITSADLFDDNADGTIDRVVLGYSEAFVAPDGASAGTFSVGGVPASAYGTIGEATLELIVSAPGTGAKQINHAGGAIADAAGNVSGTQLVAAGSVNDLAAPQATVSVSPSAPLGVGTSTVTVTFSEIMATATAPTVTLGGKTVTPATGAHTNGFRNDNRAIWEGTVAIASDDCATPTGCAVTIVANGALDPAGNEQGTGSLATEIDTIAPQQPTLGSFSATTVPGRTVPADTINMFTRSAALDATIVPGDAEGGTATLLVDGAPLAGATSGPIGGTDGSVAAGSTYADLAELQAAFGEGAHTLGLRLCDDAGNCTDSASTIEISVDTIPVDVALAGPNDDRVVAGGSVLEIAWDADEAATDLDYVDLGVSVDDGASYSTIIGGLNGADGTYEWTVPAIDASHARVRVIAVDTAGNRAAGASATAFSIDSTAPVVTVTSVGAGTFLNPGDTVDVTWSVQDATTHRVTNPITIESSTDGGTTWLPINGGAYSGANDGSEAWNLPSGSTMDLRVRVLAEDATGAIGEAASERLVTGVSGYVVRSNGALVPFGSATDDVTEGKVKNGNWLAGAAIAPNGQSGYTLTKSGRLYGFGVADVSAPKDRSVKVKRGSARDLALRSKDSGYVLDEFGRIHAFGGAGKAHPSKIWKSGDRAVALVLSEDRRGGYVLDARGKLFPFSVGKHAGPGKIAMKRLFGSNVARDFVLNADGTSGYILRSNGMTYAFGGAPKLASPDAGPGQQASALVRITDTAGYWIGTDGSLHGYGDAYGDPTTQVFQSYGARAAVSVS